MDIRAYLKDHTLLFDGGMGTLCAEWMPESVGTACELLCLTQGEKIAAIHQAYLDAGSRAIKTNTFAANPSTMDDDCCRRVIRAAWNIAAAFADRAFIFADIGPVSPAHKDPAGAYRLVAEEFLNCGADCFLLETNSTLDGLSETVRYIRQQRPEAFILLSFAALPDGYTRAGKAVFDLLQTAGAWADVDAVGLNCASGARHMAKLAAELPHSGKPFSVMPNAGYPTVLGNRTFYDGDPAYFGRQIAAMSARGARIVGGCCGTTPRHIVAAAKALAEPQPLLPEPGTAKPQRLVEENHFWNELCDPGKRPFAVELDSPENSDLGKYMTNARILKDSGAAVITIADCPIARPRMDASLVACKVHRELGMDVLPHMTCRDRNLNAIKALLLGLCAEGVHNILTITGDPIPTAERDEVKSVYNFNSRMLAGYITSLGQQSLPVPFHVFGALNVNARNFHHQLQLAKEKEEKGVCGFLTQPILTAQALDNLKLARSELNGKILGGIFPLVSHRNACFMNSEVAGVKVDERLIALYEGADRAQGEALAERISTAIAREIRPFVDGYYLVTPFARAELIGRIMAAIRAQEDA